MRSKIQDKRPKTYPKTVFPLQKSVQNFQETPRPSTRPAWLTKDLSHATFVFFDIETTGGNPSNSDVIEFAAIKYQGQKRIGQYETLLNPKRHIPKIVQQITGITDQDVANSPSIHDVIDDIIAFIDGSILVSHGVINDFAYLKSYAKNLKKLELDNFYLCTHNLVTHLLPNLPAKTLSAVATHFEIAGAHAHRALADAEFTAGIFWKLYPIAKLRGFHNIEELLKIQGDAATMAKLGSGLHASQVAKAPPGPGLFYLYNNQREVAYVAATPNLRGAILGLAELSDERDFNKLLVEVTSFSVERTSHFLEALLLEKRELKKLQLPIDPRRFEERARGLVQILIPNDMYQYIRTNFYTCPLYIRQLFSSLKPSTVEPSAKGKWSEFFVTRKETAEALLDSGCIDLGKDSLKLSNLNTTNDFGDRTQGAEIEIRSSRKVGSSIRSKKFKFSRDREDTKNFVQNSGSLKSGAGWFFGPFESNRIAAQKLNELVELLPFTDSSLEMSDRFYLIHLFSLALFGNLKQEIFKLNEDGLKINKLFQWQKRKQLEFLQNQLKEIDNKSFAVSKKYHPSHGLILVTNKDEKQLCVAVVVNSQIKKSVSLDFEDSQKLRSPRFFTRLFEPYQEEMTNPSAAFHFSEDACANIELFIHWQTQGKGEGEWIPFEEAAALYDPSILV